eukprot:13222469-Ditylum_brightwellii.AAC.1
MVAPSVMDLTKRFLQQVIPKIQGKLTYSSIKALQKILMVNAASVATTLGGGNHGHLALVMNTARYLALSGGAPFVPPQNPGPVPVPPTPFMMAAQMELLRQQHQANLLAFHTCRNTDTVLKNQLLAAVD